MDKPSFIHELIRSYTFHSPIQKGKHRLSNLAFRLSPRVPSEIAVNTFDARRLIIDTANSSYKYVYFIGKYEVVITDLFRRIIDPGDVCIDIGANMGWYSTLFQKLVGSEGEVHAFEPIPKTFHYLERNVRLNSPPFNVTMNNFALGDEEKDIELHVFADLPDGHASIATFDHAEFEVFSTQMKTLDSYLRDNNIATVNLVKIDVEGAELMVLQGASTLFEQQRLPVLEIEMALATSRGFGYIPNDLIEQVKKKGDYEFFAIDETHSTLTKINGFQRDDIGANVLCLPKGFEKQKLEGMFISD